MQLHGDKKQVALGVLAYREESIYISFQEN